MKIFILFLIISCFPIVSFSQVCESPEEISCDGIDNNGDGLTDNGQNLNCICGGNQNGGNIVCNVFVTSGTFFGDLVDEAAPLPCFSSGMNGIHAADCICQEHANDAGLSGTYYAWISMIADNGAVTTPASRFSQVSSPETIEFRLVDTAGSLIATNFSDLLDGSLSRPLNIIESGVIAPAGLFTVFTGTGNNGSASVNDCNEWNNPSAGSRGVNGNLRVNNIWSDKLQRGGDPQEEDCDTRRSLYCFEQ